MNPSKALLIQLSLMVAVSLTAPSASACPVHEGNVDSNTKTSTPVPAAEKK